MWYCYSICVLTVTHCVRPGVEFSICVRIQTIWDFVVFEISDFTFGITDAELVDCLLRCADLSMLWR